MADKIISSNFYLKMSSTYVLALVVFSYCLTCTMYVPVFTIPTISISDTCACVIMRMKICMQNLTVTRTLWANIFGIILWKNLRKFQQQKPCLFHKTAITVQYEAGDPVIYVDQCGVREFKSISFCVHFFFHFHGFQCFVFNVVLRQWTATFRNWDATSHKLKNDHVYHSSHPVIRSPNLSTSRNGSKCEADGAVSVVSSISSQGGQMMPGIWNVK